MGRKRDRYVFCTIEVLHDPEGSIGEPEACRVDLTGDTLAIHFPSGNRIRFTRIEPP